MKANIILCTRYCDAVKACASYVSKRAEQNKKITVFCEDRFTLNMERSIAAAHPRGGSFDIKVTTFSRFLRRKVRLTPLTKEGSVMVVASVILGLEGKLSYLKPTRAANLAACVYELIAQLKSSKISPEQLVGYGGSDSVLKNKLNDIYIIYSAYENYLKSGFVDESAYLSMVAQFLKNDKDILGGEVIFAGYSSFTLQGAAVIESALEIADNVTGIFCGGEAEVYTNEAQNTFRRACAELGFAPETTYYNFDSGIVQRHICNNIFEPSVFKSQVKQKTDNIFIYEASGSQDELSNVLYKIEYEIKNNGRRYKDIAVICPPEYSDSLKRTFERHSIPYFADEKKPLSEHPLSRLVVSYLKACESNYAAPECIAFIKNPYFGFSRAQTDAFENYVLASGGTYGILKKAVDENVENYEIIQEINKKALKLFNLERKMTAREFVLKIKGLLKSVQADQSLALNVCTNAQNCKPALEVFSNGIYEKLSALIDEIEAICNEIIMPVADFLQLFESGAKSKTVSLLPAFSDAVYIGGYDFAGIEPQVLFLTGLSAAVPSSSPDIGFISDRDIARLEKFRMKIEPKIQTVNMRARECVGILTSSFKDTLHISYSAYSADGKPQRKSEIILYLERLFCYEDDIALNALSREYLKNTDEKDSFYYHVYRFSHKTSGLINFITDVNDYKTGSLTSSAAATAFYYAADQETKKLLDFYLNNESTALAQRISAGRELFFGGGALSVSALQSFYECPYRNFMSMGLKLKERKTAQIRPVDSGNLLHAVMEALADKNFESLTDAQLLELCHEAMRLTVSEKSYAFAKKLPQNEVTLARLATEAVRIMRAEQKHRQSTSFKTVAAEAAFGYSGANFSALKIGGHLLRGVVDRIDSCGDYVRVIDYKSGYVEDKDLSEHYYTGRKIQLWLYLNAIKGNKIPAGAYYFDLNDNYVSSEEDDTNYKMIGITRFSGDILHLTDSNLANMQPAVSVKIKPSKKDGFSGQLLSDEEFEDYLSYSVKIAAKAAEYMHDGIICASPYDDACTRCAYSGICGFDANEGRCRKINKVSAQAVAQALSYEEEDSSSQENALKTNAASAFKSAVGKGIDKVKGEENVKTAEGGNG